MADRVQIQIPQDNATVNRNFTATGVVRPFNRGVTVRLTIGTAFSMELGATVDANFGIWTAAFTGIPGTGSLVAWITGSPGITDNVTNLTLT